MDYENSSNGNSESPPQFSPDYVSARDRFRDAARSAGGCLTTLPVSAKGPRGEDLTIDIAWFGASKPRRVLVHSCGLHGVEAFAGSAIQLQWLNDRKLPVPPADGAIVLVHVLNPYGAAWGRRFNENNVDLNRNFRAAGEFIPEPLPHWKKLNALLNPPSPPGADGFYLRALWLILRHGMPALRQAIAGGQCLNPKGLFFGGVAMEDGPSRFQAFMKERLADAERIVAIDVHTGLGRYGNDRLLVDGATERTEINRAMRKAFGESVEALDKRGIAFKARGAQHDMYFRSFPRAQVHFASQEFGTYGAVRVLDALRAENRWHLFGDGARGAVLHSSERALLEVFIPPDPKWRRAVVRRGDEVIRQALTLAFSPALAVPPPQR